MAWDNIPDYAPEVARQLLSEVKAVDGFTFHHCCRVGRSSRKLARAMGLNEFEQAILEYSGLFHDIGKAKIPIEILTKPGRLNRDEIEVIKDHPNLSAQMIQHLDNIPFFRFMLPGVRYHHEKFGGEGYPNSLAGESIPLFARIIAIVDAFDAMTNARPYRKPLSQDKAVKEIIDFTGSQFDGAIVKYFMEILPQISEGNPQEERTEFVVAHLLRAA